MKAWCKVWRSVKFGIDIENDACEKEWRMTNETKCMTVFGRAAFVQGINTSEVINGKIF